MAQRVRGSESEIILIVNGAPAVTINTIRDFTFEPELDLMSEGYLGETTERKDSIFLGVNGDLSVHLDNQDAFKFVSTVIDKARRRTPGTKINIKTTLNFPSGQRPRIIIQDCEFGSFPVNIGSRKDYVSLKMSYKASEFSILY